MQRWITTCLAVALVFSAAPAAFAHAPSGAIFTTLVDGSEVNFNQFPSKEAVYLDGGPGPGAPQTAAGLDDDTYVFQVTDPSGRRLLSTDPAECRRFEVVGGVIFMVVPAGGCEHNTGFDIDWNATTVQLYPYLDTPNPGGVYKAWVVRVDDFLAGCEELGEPNGLSVVDCGRSAGNLHGFVPRHSKTDNFKVDDQPIVEIDTRFIDHDTGAYIDGMQVEWFDTLGASNTKSSYYAPSLSVFHEAHVEGVEPGYHYIVVDHQEGCFVHDIFLTENRPKDSETVYVGNGPQTVEVRISRKYKELTVFIDVDCH